MTSKSPSRKTASSPATEAAAKTPARRAAKSAPKPASKASTKSAPKASAKPATRARAKAKAVSLQDDLKTLEARLKRADTVTRKSVASLQTIVETLEARVATDRSTAKGQLTRHVNALSSRLDAQQRHTRDVVRQELKSGLAAGGLPAFEAALARAAARMDAAELAQADAITKINRHLADMARAVDARIAQEARDRARDIAGVEARLAEAQSSVSTRIDTVERDSADALTRMGDQVARMHDKLQGARQGDADVVTEKVNGLALQTQAELEAHHARVEARIERLEQQIAAQAQPDPMEGYRLRQELGAQLLALQTRIEGLEEGSARQAHHDMPPVAAPYTTPPMPQAVAERPVAANVPDNPYAAALRVVPTAEPEPAPAPAPAPAQPAESHVPVEFDPAAYRARHADIAPAAPEAAPSPAPAHAAGLGPVELASFGPTPAPSASIAEPAFGGAPAASELEAAPLPGPSYANPAYAEEAGAEPRAVRVTGHDDTSAGSRLPGGRTLRIGALAVGVSALALLTARSLLGGNPAPNPQANLQPMLDTAGTVAAPSDVFTPLSGEPAGTATAPGPAAGEIAPVAAQSVDPIGQYAEAQPLRIDTRALGSLEAAVEADNPVALIQLGLLRLEEGRAAEAADLLQRAADREQPAAQYRLAKLYEAGEGVARDDGTARRLIESAARGGNRIAMHDLAFYHAQGRGGLTPDMRTATSWYEQAALRGVIDSQYNMGLIAMSDEAGASADIETAQFWFTVAANQGDQYAIAQRDALAPTLDADTQARVDARVAAFQPRPLDPAANGIFGPQPWSGSQAASGAREDVRLAQSYLGQLGFSVGRADGLMGSKTRKAVTEFQRTNGLAETGDVDADLLERLALAAGA